MFRNFSKKQRGFTLIELLVVISIIGFMSSVVLSSVNSSRMKARDARRIADLNQIKTALELYYSDNGYYPQSPCGWDCNSYFYSTAWGNFTTYLAPYLRTVPVDPINNASGPWVIANYSYAYGNVGRNGGTAANPTGRIQYDLTANLEDTTHRRRCGVVGYRFYFSNVYWCPAFGGSYHNQIYEASL